MWPTSSSALFIRALGWGSPRDVDLRDPPSAVSTAGRRPGSPQWPLPAPSLRAPSTRAPPTLPRRASQHALGNLVRRRGVLALPAHPWSPHKASAEGQRAQNDTRTKNFTERVRRFSARMMNVSRFFLGVRMPFVANALAPAILTTRPLSHSSSEPVDHRYRGCLTCLPRFQWWAPSARSF